MDIDRSVNKTSGWPFADGEMAQRVRAHDWAATPLGPMAHWPANLRTTVQIVLAHPFAAVVLWGPELVQIYNDSYRKLMGVKHPAGLGQPTRECWPEVWQINSPIYEQAWRGESLSFEGAHYPITRCGALEDAWFTFSYSPVRDDAGAVAGVLVTVIEATRRVRAERALRESETRTRHTAELLEQLIESAPDPIWTKDREGRLATLNSATATLLGRPRETLVGLPNSEVLPPAFLAEAQAEDQRILQEGQTIQAEQTLFDRRRGQPRIFFTIKAPLRTADGQVTGIVGIARDITERKAAEMRLADLNATLEQQVRQRTLELRTLLERAATAIIATDLRGRITVFNPAAQAMLRIPAREAIGQLELDFRDHEEMRARLHEYPREVLENAMELPEWLAQAASQTLQALPQDYEGSQRSEWTYVRADGTRVPGLASVSLLRDAQHRPTGFMAVITDLTERKALEEQLRERTHQAETANQAKTTFLANMSHEFRTPLNAVIGLSQLLLHRQLPEDIGRFIGHIHDAGEQLLALVNDVLDLSRIEAGEMRLEAVAFEPLPLLGTVLALVRPQADAKGLALVADVAPDVPQRLVGDPLRLRQVMLNLLANAVKFTHAGSVTLHANVLSRQEHQVVLGLDVVDTGIGIAPEQQGRIFDPFAQANGSITRRFGGTGLGLSIVRRLVDLMDGRLEVRSKPGQGSTFSVMLTLALPQD